MYRCKRSNQNLGTHTVTQSLPNVRPTLSFVHGRKDGSRDQNPFGLTVRVWVSCGRVRRWGIGVGSIAGEIDLAAVLVKQPVYARVAHFNLHRQ